jgi:hypothetical protein
MKEGERNILMVSSRKFCESLLHLGNLINGLLLFTLNKITIYVIGHHFYSLNVQSLSFKLKYEE